MSSLPSLSLVRNEDVLSRAPSLAELEKWLRERLECLVEFTLSSASTCTPFNAFETALRDMLNCVGRLAAEMFLGSVEERSDVHLDVEGKKFRRAPKQPRNLTTIFGVVRYWRTYLREVKERERHGVHPVDVALGLTADRLSMNVLGGCARLATKMSFAEAKATASLFMPQAPSTEVIEKTVLGLGHYTEDWFADRPAPGGDGEVLVIMIDSKGVPTATEDELARRRGQRGTRARVPSPRHRGRQRRHRWPRRPRLKKGDHSKNARFATMVVMYTLKKRGKLLLGPINKWTYASFAPKEHAFVVARREADKRGFRPESGKLIQFVSDGDTDLMHYAKRHLPTAKHTIDVAHVVEKIWNAGESIHKEGTPEHRRWVAHQRRRLLEGNAALVVKEMERHLASTPRTGPGNKGRRERLSNAIRYIGRRVPMMDYDRLIADDLEVATGVIEGAIKNGIGKRCDHGGMRWIRERAEAVLQLRCIELNGDWTAFIDDVHAAAQQRALATGRPTRLQTERPRPVPEHAQAARHRVRTGARRLRRQRLLRVA